MKNRTLTRAVKRGDAIEVRQLLAEGVDANEGSPSPLWLAAARGDTPIVALLLEAGVNPDWYVLEAAAFGNHAKTVQLLLASGVKTDLPDRAPLLNALQYSGFTREQQGRVRQLLRDAGAKELPDSYLRSRWAIRFGWPWRLRRFRDFVSGAFRFLTYAGK